MKLGVYKIGALFNQDLEGPAEKLDRRVTGENWQRWPFNVLAQVHQTAKEWLAETGKDVDGVSENHQELVNFMTGQVLELLSPANFPLTNPDVIKATVEQKGVNLAKGLKFFVQDTARKITDSPPTRPADH